MSPILKRNCRVDKILASTILRNQAKCQIPALLSVVEPTATKHLIFYRSAGTKTEQTLRSAQYRESGKSVNQKLCCQWPAEPADQWEDLIFQKLVRINWNNESTDRTSNFWSTIHLVRINRNNESKSVHQLDQRLGVNDKSFLSILTIFGGIKGPFSRLLLLRPLRPYLGHKKA